MAGYIDHRVSTRVSTEFQRVNTGSTQIVAMKNGSESRNAEWQYLKFRFHASFPLLSRESQDEITNAFYAARARLLAFRFKDWDDFAAVAAPLSPEVGTLAPVQLTKTYSFGPASAERLIQAVVTATVRDASATPVAGTLDSSLGLFTPAAPWGAGPYTWDGEFDIWVRFDADELAVTVHALEVSSADVVLQEVRVR